MVVLMVTVLVLLDQFTKGLAERFISHPIPVIGHFFELTLSYNTGAAWGFLSGKNWGIHFLTALTVVLIFGILWLLTRTFDGRARLVYGLIFAGSLGNLIDRLRMGRVTDFLTFHFGHYTFPSFNVADICITVGAVLIIVFVLIDRHFLHALFPGATPFELERDEVTDD